jgi:hypothetical protein
MSAGSLAGAIGMFGVMAGAVMAGPKAGRAALSKLGKSLRGGKVDDAYRALRDGSGPRTGVTSAKDLARKSDDFTQGAPADKALIGKSRAEGQTDYFEKAVDEASGLSAGEKVGAASGLSTFLWPPAIFGHQLLEEGLSGSFLLRVAEVLMPDKAKGRVAGGSGQRRLHPTKLADHCPSIVEGAVAISKGRSIFCHVVVYDVDDLVVRGGHGLGRWLWAWGVGPEDTPPTGNLTRGSSCYRGDSSGWPPTSLLAFRRAPTRSFSRVTVNLSVRSGPAHPTMESRTHQRKGPPARADDEPT